jgi:hypothetical protein
MRDRTTMRLALGCSLVAFGVTRFDADRDERPALGSNTAAQASRS